MYAMEQIAVAGLGSLIDFDEKGGVVTDRISMPKFQEKQAFEVQKGIMAFCHTLGKYLQNNPWNSHSENLIAQLRRILVRSAGLPTKVEANALRKWCHDFVSTKGASTHVLGENKYYEKYIKDMVPKLAFEDWNMTWPAAYAAKQGEVVTNVAYLGRSKIIPTDCFLSIDEIPLKIFVDHGKGFLKKATLPLKSNANRSFYAYHKLFSAKKPIEKIRLELSCPNASIKIETLRLTVNYSDTLDQEMFPFFESGQNEILTSCPEEKPGLFACGEEPLALTYAFANPNAYLVHINLCFNTQKPVFPENL